MVHNKLYELEQFDSSEIVNVDEMLNIFLHILPIVETEEACKNEFFLNGITNLKDMLKTFRNNVEIDGLIISETIDLFDKAAEANIIEAVANILWCIFFIWTQQYTDLERFKHDCIIKKLTGKNCNTNPKRTLKNQLRKSKPLYMILTS